MGLTQSNKYCQLPYFKVFQLWLYANLMLAVLFSLLAVFVPTLFDGKESFEFDMIFIVIVYGFIVTIPSLMFLIIANYFYRKRFTDILTKRYFSYIIIFINSIYFSITIINDTNIKYLPAYAATTLLGLLSLKAVLRKLKN